MTGVNASTNGLRTLPTLLTDIGSVSLCGNGILPIKSLHQQRWGTCEKAPSQDIGRSALFLGGGIPLSPVSPVSTPENRANAEISPIASYSDSAPRPAPAALIAEGTGFLASQKINASLPA